MGKPVPVVITVYKDKKFDFIIKSLQLHTLFVKQQNFRADQASLEELQLVL